MKNEKETRKDLIDKRLLEAGWNVDDHSQVVSEFEIVVEPVQSSGEKPSYYHGLQYSDYVLLGRDGKALAVVEAKKSSVDAAIGREQAKQYCYNIQKSKGGELPFCIYTNGHDIFFWELEHSPPRKVYGFPTRDDLERYAYIRRARRPLSGELINTQIAGRDFQIQAIRSVLEAVEKKKRKFLLVMATGTGKTRTCIALVETLMRAGWAERVLFLVDRISLRDQALDAFKEFIPNEPRWPHKGETEIVKDRRVYVSTYPTMLNVIRDETNPLSPHFFDLVVVDESHRSIYNTYQEILDYFSTMVLGLTATPTNVIDHNTFKLFECEDGVPTFAYSYEEAVNHIPPYLCSFQVMKIKTKFQNEGISKRTISLEDQKQLILDGKEVEEINYEGTELEKTVSNRGTNTLIVKQFMEECIKDPSGVIPGKSIFFCVSISHAREIESIFDSLYPEYKGEFAKVIVSDDPRVYGQNGLLNQFKKNDMPRVGISVDMLDTGIDIRELVNLVFAKPVYSYTKFWQMIGRGTRLLDTEKQIPWCLEKDQFLVLDCWDNFEYFKLNPKGKELKSQIPIPVKLFGMRLEKLEKALELGESDIARREIEKLKKQITTLPENSIVIKDAKSSLERTTDPNFWNQLGSHSENEALVFMKEVVKPLFRTVSNVDFKAMRFERDVLEVSLAKLSREEDKFETLKLGVIELVSELPLSVNTVALEADLIRKAQTNAYWATATEDDYDTLVTKLSPLLKFIDSFAPPFQVAKYDLKDLLVEKEYVEFGPQHESVSISRYKELVEEKINELTTSSPLLQKLKSGITLSESEVNTLALELHGEHPNITIDLLRRVYQNRKAQLVQFLKHILGIERLTSFPEIVSQAFENFILAHSYLSARQLQFMDLLKNFILEKENLTKRDLIESPFTQIHPEGIRGVFSPKEIDEILILTDKVLAA
ncbi:DEAD/DEAH box helicase family protein [Leptospira vanthielii]|uniref:DEAD/DEAH box helicase n=1 Tax=Leptospira vanthielii TaxID=293085 RepID=A0ABY2NSH4_9LEPT|nr:DEAD/DEAH box helicase family protein [Leptospira vanthielii]TGM60300.1 DEAD/DEAH box helicase [Leptospira vanthielii]